MELKEIALEVAKTLAAEEMGIPESEVIDDMEDFDKEMMVKFAARFLARVKEEEGKDAVAKVVSSGAYGAAVFALKPENMKEGDLLFLSPTIPEGMALVPLEPTMEMVLAAWAKPKFGQSSDDMRVTMAQAYKNMIQSAGLT